MGHVSCFFLIFSFFFYIFFCLFYIIGELVSGGSVINGPYPVYTSLYQPITAYSCLFQAMLAYFTLFQPIQAHASLFPPILREVFNIFKLWPWQQRRMITTNKPSSRGHPFEDRLTGQGSPDGSRQNPLNHKRFLHFHQLGELVCKSRCPYVRTSVRL